MVENKSLARAVISAPLGERKICPQTVAMPATKEGGRHCGRRGTNEDPNDSRLGSASISRCLPGDFHLGPIWPGNRAFPSVRHHYWCPIISTFMAGDF